MSQKNNEEDQNKWKKVTLGLMGAVTAILIVYDIFVKFFNTESQDTISSAVQKLATENWSFTFAVGAVFIGHFFWYGRMLIDQPWAAITLGLIFIGLLVLDLLNFTPPISPLWMLAIGAIAGRLFWPMSPLT